MCNTGEKTIPTLANMPHIEGPCDDCGAIIGDVDEQEPFFWTEIIAPFGLDMAFVCKRCLLRLYQQHRLACDYCQLSTHSCTCKGTTVRAARYDGCLICTGRYAAFLAHAAINHCT